MAEAQITPPIEEGSIVLLTGVILDDDAQSQIIDVLRHACGHSRFAVIWWSGEGDVEVWGPDTDIEARLKALLDEMLPARLVSGVVWPEGSPPA